MTQRKRLHLALLAAGLAVATQAAVAADPPAQAGTQAVPPQPPIEPASVPPSHQRSGLEIYRRFREGLAQPDCEPGASSRWRPLSLWRSVIATKSCCSVKCRA